MFEAGKHAQRHDNASKEVTAPSGVAVVSFMQGFHPGPVVNPSPIGHAQQGANFDHRGREAKPNVVSRAGDVAPCLTTTKRGLDGEDPARRRLAGRRHHHGAQPPAPSGSTRVPPATPRASGPPKPIWALARPDHPTEAGGAPPPRGGCASTAVVDPCPSPGSRRSSLPNRRRVTHRRRHGSRHHRARERPRRRRRRPGFARRDLWRRRGR